MLGNGQGYAPVLDFDLRQNPPGLKLAKPGRFQIQVGPARSIAIVVPRAFNINRKNLGTLFGWFRQVGSLWGDQAMCLH